MITLPPPTEPVIDIDGMISPRWYEFFTRLLQNSPIYGLVDGVTAPGATDGIAKIYVDVAGGDLKVIFGDATVKTIVIDT